MVSFCRYFVVLTCFFLHTLCDEIIPAEALIQVEETTTKSSPVLAVTPESKVLDSSIQAPVNKKDVLAEELKKSIQEKVKRLHHLKKEIKRIKKQLNKERHLKALQVLSPEEQTTRIARWKHRMRTRVKELHKKVNRMERQMKHRRQKLNGKRRPKNGTLPLDASGFQFGSKKRSNRRPQNARTSSEDDSGTTSTDMSWPSIRKSPPKGKNDKRQQTTAAPLHTATLAVSTTTLSPTTIVQSPLAANERAKKVRRSHQGENGQHCQTHHDCTAGHCCHHFGATGKAVCIHHDLNPGSHCKHSCACAGGLKCVRIHSVIQAQMPAQCRPLSPKQIQELASKSIQRRHLMRVPIHLK